MIRVLHVVTTMDYGGVETLLMSVYRKIDRDRIQFDFLCHNRLESAFQDEIRSLGGRMFLVHGPRHGGFFNYLQELKRFFTEHPEYRIVHAHMNRDNAWALMQAKRAGVPVRVSHSHNVLKQCSFLYSLYVSAAKQVNRRCLTHRFACSREAGEDLYGKGTAFTIIPNAIDASRFAFDPERRKAQRAEWKLTDDHDVLIGHVGRFDLQKNHRFILRVFAALRKTNPRAKLVLIGSGPLEEEIRREAHKLCLDDAVIFAGSHRDLQGMYAAMDAFVFPSLYEGLGIVAVEAQCCGLPVLASAFVPQEAAVTDRMSFLSLDAPPEIWAERISIAAEECRDNREKYQAVVQESPYCLDHVVRQLFDFYMENSREG